MNVFKTAVVTIGCCGVMLGASGCASKAVVKKDEPLGAKAANTKPAVAADTKAASGLKKAATTATPAASSAATLQQPVKAAKPQTAFEKVYFNFDSSDLSSSARNSLSRDAELLLKEQKEAKIVIEGNCDERGSAEYNLALGERRAKAAAKYLTALGVQPARLSTISYGKERPAVQGSDEAAWAKNRRDEFVVQK